MLRVSENVVLADCDFAHKKRLYHLKHGTYSYRYLNDIRQDDLYLISFDEMKKQFYSRRITECTVFCYLRHNEEVHLENILWAYEIGILKNSTRFQLDIFQKRGFGGFRNFYEELYDIIIVQNKQIISKIMELIIRTPKNQRELEFMGKLQNAGFICQKGRIYPCSFHNSSAVKILIYFDEKPPKL